MVHLYFVSSSNSNAQRLLYRPFQTFHSRSELYVSSVHTHSATYSCRRTTQRPFLPVGFQLQLNLLVASAMVVTQKNTGYTRCIHAHTYTDIEICLI